MLVTTSHILQGYRIVRYISPVSASVANAMVFYKDILSSIRDFFGGTSESWTETVNKTVEKCISNLVSQAHSLGANAIIGLIQNISFIQKGKSGGFIVVTVIGTAVLISEDKKFN